MLANIITDPNRFLTIVAEAIAAAQANCQKETERDRWIRAIAKAVVHIEQHGEFMQYDVIENHLLIWSQESGEIYSANGICQCKAYKDGMKYRQLPYPCFHRAAARLLRNYLGLSENHSPSFPDAPQAVSAASITPPAGAKKHESDTAPYISGGYRKTADVKVEGFRL